MKFEVVALCALLGITGCTTDRSASFGDQSVRDSSGHITSGGKVGVLRLMPGDCFILGADEIEVVDGVPCEDGHNAEVFSIFEMASTDWPGSRAVAQVAEKGCVDRFRGATGHAFDPVHVAITGYAPSERSWGDDRKVLCVVTTHDLGSVRGRVTK